MTIQRGILLPVKIEIFLKVGALEEAEQIATDIYNKYGDPSVQSVNVEPLQ